MEPHWSLLLVCTGILVTLHTATGSDNVVCYAQVNEVTGQCEDYLGEGVSETDCCNNIMYGFKKDSSSACEACQPAEWGHWSDWSPCSVSCLEGVQNRQRVCIGQGDCEGKDIEVQVCSLTDCCPREGGWSSWSEWSSCSVTCAKGQRKRTRHCNNPPPACGASCPGPAEESEECDTRTICPTHGQWSNWENWGKCSFDCTIEGSKIFPVQSRVRLCNNPAPSKSPLGNACVGSDRDTRECTSVPFCPVNGQWGKWQPDSECSVICGVGRVTEKRFCDNPAPKHGGKYCVGSPSRHTICNTKKPCPIDGKWTKWDEWSVCERLSEGNIKCRQKEAHQYRKRKCIGQRLDGAWCEGEYRESRNCYNVNDCFSKQPGKWTEWSQWGLCSSPCGTSERTRYRECLPVYPDWPTMIDGPVKTLEVFFWGTPKYKCEELEGQTKRVEEKKECKNTPPC